MNILFWGLTIGVIGKLLVSITVIIVHTKITREKHIDGLVLMTMHREKFVAILGIACILVGYLLELAAYDLFI